MICQLLYLIESDYDVMEIRGIGNTPAPLTLGSTLVALPAGIRCLRRRQYLPHRQSTEAGQWNDARDRGSAGCGPTLLRAAATTQGLSWATFPGPVTPTARPGSAPCGEGYYKGPFTRAETRPPARPFSLPADYITRRTLLYGSQG